MKAIKEFEAYRARVLARELNPRTKPLKINWSTNHADEVSKLLYVDTTPLVVAMIFEMALEQRGKIFDPKRDDLMNAYKSIWMAHWDSVTAPSVDELDILNDAGIILL